MKKNIILSTIIIILFALDTLAQDAYLTSVVPGQRSDLYWHASGEPGTGSTLIPCYTKVTCDTIQVNGKVYHYVDATGSNNGNTYGCPLDNYIREDTTEQKIYFTTGNPEDEEKVLIDFSLEQGDTIFNYWSESSIEVIDTVEYLEIAGEVRKVLVIVPLYTYFIEGIGHSMNGLGIPQSGLKSFQGFVVEDHCWSVSNNEISTNQEVHYSIQPNPSEGQIFIKKINHHNLNAENIVEIRSIKGDLLHSFKFMGESHFLDTSKFPKGILIVTLISDQLVETKKIVNR